MSVMEDSLAPQQTTNNTLSPQTQTVGEIQPARSFLKSTAILLLISASLGIIFHFSDALFFYLTFFVAQSISGGVSFMGIPTGMIQAIYLVSFLKTFIIFPILVVIGLLVFKVTARRFGLPSINFFIKIIVMASIISYTFWISPLTSAFKRLFGPSERKIITATQDNKSWKTYVDKEGNFSLQYPSVLSTKELDIEGEQYINFMIPDKEDGPYFRVVIYPTLGPEEAYKYNLGGLKRFLEEEKEVVVDDYKGKMLVIKDENTRNKNNHIWGAVAIISNDKTYEFRGTLRNINNPECAIFEDVLSSVKFSHKGINKFEILPDTSSWTTYTHPLINYSVKHPSYWRIEDLPVRTKSDQLSHTNFYDTKNYDNLLAMEVYKIDKFQEIVESDEGGTCTNKKLGQVGFRSGKEVDYKQCEYNIYYLVKFPEKGLLITIFAERGTIDNIMIDSFISTLVFPN